jgi:hypothetical protein
MNEPHGKSKAFIGESQVAVDWYSDRLGTGRTTGEDRYYSFL